MKIAAIQASPVFLDSQATLQKTLSLMREAAANGAELCAFPETFLSGYPIWLRYIQVPNYSDPGLKAAYAAYLEGAVRADGPELAAVREEAGKLGLFTYLGFIERAPGNGSAYCALAAIHPELGVVSIHRKLKPTHFERLVWAEGDGNGLQVHPWNGFRVGGLNCWENWMPLARYALYAQGEQLHVAVWPGRSQLTVDISRHIAAEARVFVLSVGGVYHGKDIPDAFPLKKELLAKQPGYYFTGGSVIVGPDGKTLQGPVDGEETLLYADVDVKRVLEEHMNFDPVGHYARPDVLSLHVNRQRQDPLA